jgi:hypothetical protein
MPLVQIVIVLIIAGVALWLINRFIHMAPPIKTILNVVVIVVICLWLLSEFGVLGPLNSIRIGR